MSEVKSIRYYIRKDNGHVEVATSKTDVVSKLNQQRLYDESEFNFTITEVKTVQKDITDKFKKIDDGLWTVKGD